MDNWQEYFEVVKVVKYFDNYVHNGVHLMTFKTWTLYLYDVKIGKIDRVCGWSGSCEDSCRRDAIEAAKRKAKKRQEEEIEELLLGQS